ncbi:hypothetical protein HMPREF9141_1175 [Prevotella multiformis DSM 16608]|uniref:Uncharacterized protein n=1 Tax=Prevotella multiformis DSM 16608 TaxID=888743 RepID=F0F6F3_9BACT|nr:hypothetical protein HMPREF9141_1175 [Prevotella multiformis DSM 16608]
MKKNTKTQLPRYYKVLAGAFACLNEKKYVLLHDSTIYSNA